MPTCRECGGEIGSDARRCPHCGASTDYSAQLTLMSCAGLVLIAMVSAIGAVLGDFAGAFWGGLIALLGIIIAGGWWLSRR